MTDLPPGLRDYRASVLSVRPRPRQLVSPRNELPRAAPPVSQQRYPWLWRGPGSEDRPAYRQARPGMIAQQRQWDEEAAQYDWHHGTPQQRAAAVPRLLWNLPINPLNSAMWTARAVGANDPQSAAPMAAEAVLAAEPIAVSVAERAAARGLFGARAPRVDLSSPRTSATGARIATPREDHIARYWNDDWRSADQYAAGDPARGSTNDNTFRVIENEAPPRPQAAPYRPPTRASAPEAPMTPGADVNDLDGARWHLERMRRNGSAYDVRLAEEWVRRAERGGEPPTPLPRNPTKPPTRASDGSVLPVRERGQPPHFATSGDLAEAANMRPARNDAGSAARIPEKGPPGLLFRGVNPNSTRNRVWPEGVTWWTDNPRMSADFAQSGGSIPDVSARAVEASHAFDRALHANAPHEELQRLAATRDAAMREAEFTGGFTEMGRPGFRNPLVIDRAGGSVPTAEMYDEIARARRDGHDAVIWENGVDGATGPSSPSRVVAVLNDESITPRFSPHTTRPDGGAGAGGNAQQAYLAQLRSQGFDTETPLYRGHTGNPTTGSFRPSEGMLGEGVSLTHDPAQASRWAARNHNEAPTVHRVYIRGRIAEAPLTIEEARAQGYAGYRHRGEGGYDETAIFDPANIAPSLPDTRAPAVSPPQPPRVAPPRGPFDRPPQSNAFVGVPIFAKQDIAAAQRAISHPPQRPPASYRGPGGRMAALSRFAAPEMRAPGPRIAHHIVDVGQVNAVRPGHFGRAIYMDRDPAITTHLGDFGSTRAQRFDYRVRGALATPEQFERLGQEALQRQGYVGVQAPDYFAIWDKRAIGRASARGPLPNYSSRQRTTPSAAISEEHPLPRTSMYAAARRGPQASAQDKALATLLGVGGAFPTAAATANFATGQRREYQALDRMQRMNAEDRAGLQRYRSQETGPGNMGGKVGNKPQVLPQGTPKERAAALSELHSLFAGRPDIPITEDMIRRQIIVMREGLHGKIPNDAPAGMVR